MDIYSYITDKFEIEKKDIKTYSPLTLAFIGDEIYDLVVRSVVVAKGNTAPNKLHARCAAVVKAASQAKLADRFLDEGIFTEEESEIYRRGRNANPHTTAKNASHSDYRKATGLEAVIGYLYIIGDFDRVVELVSMADI